MTREPPSVPKTAVIALTEAPERLARARRAASRLGATLMQDTAAVAADWQLVYDDFGLTLIGGGPEGLRVDIRPPHRSRPEDRITRRQPLGRALGRPVRTVVDATAGFGDDALRLAGFGLEVTAVERSPIAALCLEERVAQLAAGDDPELAAAAGRLTVVEGEGIEVLAGLTAAPDVVYLDPMFPPKRKRSARPRKAMQVLGALVGPDADVDSLLAAAIAASGRRVVLKRPDDAPPLGRPAASYGGTTVRYDMYTGRSARGSDDV